MSDNNVDLSYKESIECLISDVNLERIIHYNSGTLFTIKNMLHQELERIQKNVDPRPKSDK